MTSYRSALEWRQLATCCGGMTPPSVATTYVGTTAPVRVLTKLSRIDRDSVPIRIRKR